MNPHESIPPVKPEPDGAPDVHGVETPPQGPASQPPDLFERRLQRIDDHLRESLERKGPRTSAVGAVVADVMKVELQFSEALRKTLGDGPVAPEILSRNWDAIQMLLRLAKHVTNMSQVDWRMLEREEAALKSGNSGEEEGEVEVEG